LLQTGCAHTNEQLSGKKIGYLVNPNGDSPVVRIDYDVEVQGKTTDCFFYVAAGTGIENLGKKGTPEGWQFEASNIRILDGPFSGTNGYVARVFIKTELTDKIDSDLIAKATGPPPCRTASKVNIAKLQAINSELHSRKMRKIQLK
jgi:hypothetical protein